MVYNLTGRSGAVSLKKMICHYEQSSDPTESVKNLVSGFGGKVYVISTVHFCFIFLQR